MPVSTSATKIASIASSNCVLYFSSDSLSISSALFLSLKSLKIDCVPTILPPSKMGEALSSAGIISPFFATTSTSYGGVFIPSILFMKASNIFSFDSCVKASTSTKVFPMRSFSENPVNSNPFLLTNVILPVVSTQIIASGEVSIISLSFCSLSFSACSAFFRSVMSSVGTTTKSGGTKA